MEENVKVPFWQKTWFVVVMCLFVPPAGIALLWLTKKGNQVLRIVLTVVLAIYSIPWLSGIFSGVSSADTQTNTSEQIQQEEVIAETDTQDDIQEEPVTVEESPAENARMTAEEFKANCIPVPYDELARYPDNYLNKNIVIIGKVTQVIEDGSTLQCRIAIDDDYDQMCFVDYSLVSSDQGRILEDDYVTFWGSYYGLLTYQTVLGANQTIPSMLAIYSQIN
ncbi:hypothetical protein Q5O14_07705 [Eubacteriaceae bacterium ES2]|nr:hypothetical protein Q5O14_07705 [Eubacteriaceae bacterium ES2]